MKDVEINVSSGGIHNWQETESLRYTVYKWNKQNVPFYEICKSP